MMTRPPIPNDAALRNMRMRDLRLLGDPYGVHALTTDTMIGRLSRIRDGEAQPIDRSTAKIREAPREDDGTTKLCQSCDQTKPTKSFSEGRNSCNSCRNHQAKERSAIKAGRWCRGCQTRHVGSEFEDASTHYCNTHRAKQRRQDAKRTAERPAA